MHRTLILVLGIGVLAIALFVLNELGASPGGGTEGPREQGAVSHQGVGAFSSVREDIPPPHHEDRGLRAHAVLGTIHGVVVDGIFGYPLPAVIEWDDGSVSLSDSLTGRFSRMQGTEKSPVGVVSCPGYMAARFDACGDQTDLRVELSAKQMASVLVLDPDGQPVEGASVSWISATGSTGQGGTWNNPVELSAGVAVEKKTDIEGRSYAPVSRVALAQVSTPNLRTTKQVKVLAGEEAVVWLPGCDQTVRFLRSGTGQAIVGLHVDSLRGRAVGSLIQSMVTDDQGEIAIGREEHSAMLRLAGASRTEEKFIVLSGNAMVRPDPWGGDLLYVPTGTCEVTVEVEVQAYAGSLFLTDKRTGDPIDAFASLHFQQRGPTLDSHGILREPRVIPGPRGFDAARGPHAARGSEVRSGVLHIPFYLTQFAPQRTQEPPYPDLVVVVEGYFPLRISGFTDLDATGIYELDPAPLRTLRIRYEDGQAFSLPVMAFARKDRIQCFKSSGDPDGIYGPFDWWGGPLQLELRGRTVPISAPDLNAHDVVEIVLPVQTGSILVKGVPSPLHSALLRSKLGLRIGSGLFHPTEVVDGSCRFDGLSPGKYLVGPAPWVEGTYMQGLRVSVTEEPQSTRSRVQVLPGKESVIQWQAGWSGSVDIQGTIQLMTDRRRLRPLLFPLYDVPDSPELGGGNIPAVILGRSWNKIGLDSRGLYRIPNWEPVPDLIAICLPTDPGNDWGGHGNMFLVDTVLPGESLQVELATIILHLKGERPASPMRVSFDCEAASLSHPIRTALQRPVYQWFPPSDLVLEGLPIYVHRIQIHDRYLDVNPKAGMRQSITVDLQDLPRIDD